jgi:hypothetical protein
MKKACILILIGAFLLLFSPVFAQDNSGSTQKKDVYTKTFVIKKIFVHRFGYLVKYSTSKMDIADLYISVDHFTGTSGKARLIYGQGPEYPYLAVTWVEGKIDHVSIYAIADMNDLSWGMLHGGDELQPKFQTELAIQF